MSTDPIVIVYSPDTVATARLSALELTVVEYEHENYAEEVLGVAITQSRGQVVINYDSPEDTFSLLHDLKEHIADCLSEDEVPPFILFVYESSEIVEEGERKKRLSA